MDIHQKVKQALEIAREGNDHFIDAVAEPGECRTLMIASLSGFLGISEASVTRSIDLWVESKRAPMIVSAANCPPMTRDQIVNYLDHRIEPGSFVRAVLENDLRQAVLHADSENLRHLADTVAFCDIRAPRDLWGSRVNVTLWLRSSTNDQTQTRSSGTPPN